MRTYSSFLVRCWLSAGAGEGASVFEVEEIRSGARRRVDSFTEMQQWMLAAAESRSARPEADADEADDTPEVV